MALRSGNLQSFVDAASEAFGEFARDEASRRTIRLIFAALTERGAQGAGTGRRLPACAHLEAALAVAAPRASLRRLIDGFRAIEPSLAWRRRAHDRSASDNFEDGHANAVILGPGGLEDRSDVWLGVTVMAPRVRYPDHDHAPEEVYLVLSDGEFRRGESDWFAPGVGGSFYNEPGVSHAMRSLDTPLFAFWALRSNGAAEAAR